MPHSKTKNIIDPSRFSGLKKEKAENILKALEEMNDSELENPIPPTLSGLYNTNKLDVVVKYNER